MFHALQRRFQQILNFKRFAGKKLTNIFIFSIFVGFVYFLIEYAFVYALQGFLSSLGLFDMTNLSLPSWYPKSNNAALIILCIVGFCKGTVELLNNFLMYYGSIVFSLNVREKIALRCLDFGNVFSTMETLSLFSDTVDRASLALRFALTLVLSLTTTVFLVLMIFHYAPIEAGLGILLLSICSLPAKKLNNYISKAGITMGKEWAATNSKIIMGIKNHFYLKIFGLVAKEKKGISSSIGSYSHNHVRFHFINSIKLGVPTVLGVVIIALLAYVAINYVHTPGVKLLPFFYLFLRFVQSSNRCLQSLNGIRFQASSLRNLYQWDRKVLELDKQSKLKPSEISVDPKSIKEPLKLRLENIYFRYDENGPWIIEDLNLEVTNGDILLIKGKSGSGKSTLLSLILGINAPQKGRVTLNDHDLSRIQNSIKELFAYVGSEPYLIPDTIRNNLTYGLNASDFSDEEIWNALDKAKATNFVKPLGLQTFLNEAVPLSTGQKQRLAIARAFLRKPKILILDEFSSNLDKANEENIFEELKDHFPHLITLIVSHRPTFDEKATRTISLEASR